MLLYIYSRLDVEWADGRRCLVDINGSIRKKRGIELREGEKRASAEQLLVFRWMTFLCRLRSEGRGLFATSLGKRYIGLTNNQ